MYKIITNISILEKLNQISKDRDFQATGIENTDSKYCDAIKHPLRDEWVIPIDENLLRIYNPSNLDYLLSDLIPEIPTEWSWPFTLRPIRIIIPLWMQAMAQTYTDNEEKWYYLKELISGMVSILGEFILTDKENVMVYLEELYPQHRYILELFINEGIKIEP